MNGISQLIIIIKGKIIYNNRGGNYATNKHLLYFILFYFTFRNGYFRSETENF